MNRIAALSIFLAFILAVSPAFAGMYTGADIIISGNNFTHISSPANWFKNGSAIYTCWATTGGPALGWIEYQTFLLTGNWNVGLNVINRGYLGNDDWYSHFEVLNSFTGETMRIEASDSQINHGYQTIEIADNGIYTFRYSWLNDKWNPNVQGRPLDANIQINDVFFDNLDTSAIPEPATALLLGSGILGMGIVRRFRKK